MINNESQAALDLCLEIQNDSANPENIYTKWRSLIIASKASYNLSDILKSQEYAAGADRLLSEIEKDLGAENYKIYISRPDVQIYRK